ncbi:MAG: 3-phosphoglycerate dehydrogenase family protein [Bacteroidetes bacterium]|nr:3-phosphoglycerate dehydrogenase family protein [Bacteroidota bacterium]
MKVLVADKFEQSGLDGLKLAGCTVIYDPDVKDDSLTRSILTNTPDVLVVRSTKVTAPMMENSTLKLIVRAGAGYNTIDVQAASSKGIYVSNCPGKNSIAVAELAFGLLLGLDRRIPDNVADLRSGKWNKKDYSKAKGIYGKTLGLVGFGNIGKEMAVRAKSFGLTVLVWSRSLTQEKAAALGVTFAPTLGDVARHSDLVSVHLALSKDTRGIIGKDFFDAMKKGAYFINTARGEIIDQDALSSAIREKGLRAGLDVFANEPDASEAAFTDPVVQLPGVYGTHHIGASTDQAQEAIASETVRIIREFKETGHVPNVVNLSVKSPATWRLIVRHLNQPGVLASVLDGIKAENINVLEMENIVFADAQAAVARINLADEPHQGTVEKVKSLNANIIAIDLVKLA